MERLLNFALRSFNGGELRVWSQAYYYRTLIKAKCLLLFYNMHGVHRHWFYNLLGG